MKKLRCRNTYFIHKLWYNNGSAIIPQIKRELQTPLTIKQPIPTEYRPIFLEALIRWIFSMALDQSPSENNLTKWDLYFPSENR